MRYVAFLSSVLVAVSAAAPAYAQTTDSDATYTGFHVEAVGGVDHVKGDGGKDTNGLYGAALGYDIAAGGAVFGGEGEVTWSGVRSCDNNVLAAGDSLCEKAGRDLYAGGRAGFIVGGRTLLYAKAGYTNARAKGAYTLGTTSVSDSKNLDGVRAGVGLETDVGRLLVKLEYRYSNYEDGVTRHQGVIGLGVRF